MLKMFLFTFIKSAAYFMLNKEKLGKLYSVQSIERISCQATIRKFSYLITQCIFIPTATNVFRAL